MPDMTGIREALEQANDAVTVLSDRLDLQEGTTRRIKRANRIVLFSVLFDVALTLAVGYGLLGVDRNQGRINDLQETLQVQTERNRTAQCAVNALFLQFEPRTTVNPSYTDEQRAQQVQAYATLRQIGADLGCPGQ